MSYPNSNPETDLKVDSPDVNIFWVSLIVEGGLVVLALIFAWGNFYQRDQPLSQLGLWPHWKFGLIWGTVATVPPLLYLVAFHYWKPKFFAAMREVVDEKLKPMFRSSSLIELLVISLMAGFCEEVFFRWSLQGGIASWLTAELEPGAANLIALIIASALFAVCHWVNKTYVIITFAIGLYLGWLMIATDNWLVPAIAHALYDFIALVYISRWRKS